MASIHILRKIQSGLPSIPRFDHCITTTQLIGKPIFSPGYPQSYQPFHSSAGGAHPLRNRGGRSVSWHSEKHLDYFVLRAKNLRAILNVKNMIKETPSNSIPLSVIANNKRSVGITFQPVEFLRRYNSVFEEFSSSGGNEPHFRLTPSAMEFDSEERLVYESETYRQEVADRILKLLMIRRMYWVPLALLDQLKWDLGLPEDYLESLVPHFPHYFQVTRVKESSSSYVDALELVCWDSDLSVSVIENGMNVGSGGLNGTPFAFPQHLPMGFHVDVAVKRWLDNWQKLPYFSPYENAMHLPSKGNESDKWAVAVMHELLHLTVDKRMALRNFLRIGIHMGIQARFKRALLNHPDIFYVSSMNPTHTVLLKECYGRRALTDVGQMMDWRRRYLHFIKTSKIMETRPRTQDGAVKHEQPEGMENLSDGEVEEMGDGIAEEGNSGSSTLPYFSDEDHDEETDEMDYDDDEDAS